MANSAILFLALVTLATAKPIMVTYGTSQEPIVPRPKPAPQAQPRTIISRSPAPVSEETDDLPNPSTYRPMVPHQYRTKLYAQKPPPTLILGTPIDQRYTPSINKFEIYRKQGGRSLGVDYTGPNIFEKQDYEVIDENRKTTLQPSVRYVKPHYFQYWNSRQDQNQKYVPQIGIIYSAGVRYYVPQIAYYNEPRQQEDEENSVYDQTDEKHFYRKNPNQ